MNDGHLRNIDDRSAQWRPGKKLLDERQWTCIKKRYDMTTRELQVARLVCSGMSNEEVASNLMIKQSTVKVHIRNIYRKMSVKSKILMFLRFLEEAQGTAQAEELVSHVKVPVK